MMRIASLYLAVLVSGCATSANVSSSAQVRTAPPANVEATVTSYFDVVMPDRPSSRRLSFGIPEVSRCALSGGSGKYLGWVVPVIDENPSASMAVVPGGSPAATEATTPMQTGSTSGTASASLDEVSIRGTRYFFWFSNNTISAVTRRLDICP